MERVVRVLFAAILLLALGLNAVAQEGEEEQAKARMNAGTFTGLAMRGIGPALMSGRISDLAIDPNNPSVWYIAVGSGGVWKTTNAATTVTPIFDGQASYSIGCLTIDPNDSLVIWVGTGENVSGRHVGYGDGVYKSLDGGETWKNMGLKETEHISKILVDPRDSNVVWLASEGPLWSSGGERGLYKSTDGGETWEISLAISENTGVVDVAFDPRNPDVLYAAAYQRRRHIAAFVGGGPESSIYKTVDGGATWKKIDKGLPRADIGKIGLAVSPQKPDIVYATVEAAQDLGGFYVSETGGESWVKRSDFVSYGTGPHYYQEIFCDPYRFNRIYQMAPGLHVSDDGGANWRSINQRSKHGDNHALAFHPSDPNYLLCGSDGGVYESFDQGETWKFLANLPVTQFYKLSLDNDSPVYNVVGGTQDNNTQVGPTRTLNVQGIRNSDWFITVGGDGYDCAMDPEDPNVIYSEWQVGGLMRYDKASGELIDIQPQPEPGEDEPRWNWDSPIIVSPHSHTRLYFASQRVYRSDDRGDSWTPISPDLSRGIDRLKMEFMGTTWGADAVWDHGAMSYFGNVVTLSESPLVEGLLYAGSDDGLIHVTEDGGANWRKVEKIPGVPEFAFVTKLQASLHDANTVYASFDNHKVGDFKPYIYKSSDRGATWKSITGDMPDRHLIWSLVQDHVKPELLFAATEFGIFFTVDEGGHWIKLTGGAPTIAFRDIEIQRRENDVVGASFGRGFYVLDDYSPLRLISEEALGQEVILFPIKDAQIYIPMRTLGGGEKASQGDSFFVAPNPPFGAVFTYYLKDSLKSRQDTRREAEGKLRKEGKPIEFPDWEDVELEDLEEKPVVILTIADDEGNTVRRLTGPASAGFQRVAWDLRYPSTMPTRLEQPGRRGFFRGGFGAMAAPGNYTVTLSKYEDGKLTQIGEPQSFNTVPLNLGSLPAQDNEEVLAFQLKVGELARAIMGASAVIEERQERLRYIKKSLLDTPNADKELIESARAIELRLYQMSEALEGDLTRQQRNEPTSPSIAGRLQTVAFGSTQTTAGPTKTHRRQYELAAQQFGELLGSMRELIEVDIQRLEDAMEAAGAPWTPGRKIPDWKP